MKLFGREPAAWAALIGGFLALLLSLDQFGLTAETVGLWMALVNACLGVYVAWATRDTLLGVILTLLRAGVALFAGYGMALDEDTVAQLVSLVTLISGFWQQSHTAPLVRPTFRNDANAPIYAGKLVA